MAFYLPNKTFQKQLDDHGFQASPCRDDIINPIVFLHVFFSLIVNNVVIINSSDSRGHVRPQK